MSRLFKQFLIAFLLIAAVSLIVFSMFIRSNGRQLARGILSQAFQRPVEVGEVNFLFPFGMYLNRLRIEGVLKAEEVHLQLGFPFLLDKQLVVSRIRLTGPVVVLKKTKENKFTLMESAAEPGVRQDAPPAGAGGSQESPAPQAATAGAQPAEERITGVFLENLHIAGGKLEYVDVSGEKDFQLLLDQIDLKARQISFPLKPLNMRFDLSGVVLSRDIPFSGSRVEGRGWINFQEKNMDANLQVIEPDGRVGISADLVAKNNDLTVKGKMHVKPPEGEALPEKPKDLTVDEFLLGALESTGIEMNLEFSFATKMDDFQMGSIAFAGDVGYQGAESDDIVPDDLKSIGKQFEEFGKKFYEETIKPPDPKEPAAANP